MLKRLVPLKKNLPSSPVTIGNISLSKLTMTDWLAYENRAKEVLSSWGVSLQPQIWKLLQLCHNWSGSTES